MTHVDKQTTSMLLKKGVEALHNYLMMMKAYKCRWQTVQVATE